MAKLKRARRPRRFLRRRRNNFVKTVRKFMRNNRPEVKHLDVAAGANLSINNDAGTTGNSNILPLSTITQGTSDFGQRIGDQIRLKKFILRGMLTNAAGQPSVPIRCVVFFDKSNPDATVSTISRINQFFQSQPDNTAFAPFALYDWDNRSGFQVIYDKIVWVRSTVSTGSTPSAATSSRMFNLNLNLKNKLVQYFNNSQDIAKNQMYIVFYTQTDGNATLSYTWRVTYTDA